MIVKKVLYECFGDVLTADISGNRGLVYGKSCSGKTTLLCAIYNAVHSCVAAVEGRWHPDDSPFSAALVSHGNDDMWLVCGDDDDLAAMPDDGVPRTNGNSGDDVELPPGTVDLVSCGVRTPASIDFQSSYVCQAGMFDRLALAFAAVLPGSVMSLSRSVGKFTITVKDQAAEYRLINGSRTQLEVASLLCSAITLGEHDVLAVDDYGAMHKTNLSALHAQISDIVGTKQMIASMAIADSVSVFAPSDRIARRKYIMTGATDELLR